MARNAVFEDLDDKAIYDQSLARVLDQSTRNFVVDFGLNEAKIAFDVDAEEVARLLKAGLPKERPVRWINIWAPNRQTNLIDLLGKHYKFSPRLCAIIKSVPQQVRRPADDKRSNKRRPQQQRKGDVELATTSIDARQNSLHKQLVEDSSHYGIAKNMMHYQSNDIGTHFLCIGANWMHEAPQPSGDVSLVSEEKQSPLWTWLVLCDDNTVISVHEDPGTVDEAHLLRSIRDNTYSILSQLSHHGHEAADPTSIQTIRQTLALDGADADPGLEGASNLFYYLFDDWRAVYKTISRYRRRLNELQSQILSDITRTSNNGPNIEIIPRLHSLGRHIRLSDHLYAAYQYTIDRILKARANEAISARSPGNVADTSKKIGLANSAVRRFERLSDRIQFMILNEMQEFLAEKEALVSTYFNINAQKDSEATARLSRAATLLGKLSVLFLPVSLMTAYFSVQIPDLQHYSGKDYWTTFAVIMSISFLCLFFFSRLLMWVTDTLDALVKAADAKVKGLLYRRSQRGRQAMHDDDEDADEDKLE